MTASATRPGHLLSHLQPNTLQDRLPSPSLDVVLGPKGSLHSHLADHLEKALYSLSGEEDGNQHGTPGASQSHWRAQRSQQLRRL